MSSPAAFAAPRRLGPTLLLCLAVAALLSSHHLALVDGGGAELRTVDERAIDEPLGPVAVAPGAPGSGPTPTARFGPWVGRTTVPAPLAERASSPSKAAQPVIDSGIVGVADRSVARAATRIIIGAQVPSWTEPVWIEGWALRGRPAAPTETAATPTPTAPPTTPVPAPAAAAPTGATLEVADASQWRAAVAAARPGDTIRLTASIGQPLQYRGPRAAGSGSAGADGAPGRPITITAADGVWIDPGNHRNVLGALDVIGADHIHVVGVRVRNSQFGIRLLEVSGSADAPVRITNNQVVDIGHAGIHVAGDLSDHTPSRFVRVEGNVVRRTGLTESTFGEGIYLGYGTREWVDRTSDIVVVGNRISHTAAEGIDIKPGTRNITVAGNSIHDLSPINGGAISVHYVGVSPNPDPGTPSNVVVTRNRIWNLNLDDRGGSNDWAIWVGHGGVAIESNAVWGLRNDPGSARAVRVRGLHDFGPHPIRIADNVFWTAAGWMAEGNPSGGGNVQASGNRGPAGATGVEVPIEPGPGVPALGTGGTADAGGGPGSALGFG
ncbi:MAG: right-handed parallel beta-helix repeat-containing protein [Actinomycetota bacterium]